MPVVSSSSPPDIQGVGSSNSVMWTQRIGDSAPSRPAASVSPTSSSRLWRVSIRWPSLADHSVPRLAQDVAQDRFDLLEFLAPGDQWGRQLDHGVAPVVRPADQTAPVKLAGEEAAQ